MKFNAYLESLRKEDPEFDKWFKEYWLKWTPPKRKVRVFLDRNLPQEFKNALIDYQKFKAFEEVKCSSRPDEDIFSYCYNAGYLIITLDNDFWNDRRFPLSRCPGVIIIASTKNARTNDYLDSLARFLTHCDLVGGIQRFPDFAKRMKFRVSQSGFVNKFIAYDGKVEVVKIEY